MVLKKVFKWIGAIAAVFTAITVLLLVSLEFFVSDSYVARMVTKYAGQMLNARMEVKEIGFTAFSHFPSVGVKLTDGIIVSTTHHKDSVLHARTPKQADSLVSFKEFTLLFNPLKLLAGNIEIHGIILKKPQAYAYVSPSGYANWDILSADDQISTDCDTLQQESPSSEEFNFNINVKNIRIEEGGRFTYDNRVEQLRASAFMNSVNLQGNFTDKIDEIKLRKGNFSRLNMALSTVTPQQERTSLRLAIDTLNAGSVGRGKLEIEAKTRTNIRIARNSITRNLPVDINGHIQLGRRNENAFSFEQMKISLAKIPIVLDGKVQYSTDSLHTDNFTAHIDEFPVEEFLQYVPESIVPHIKKLHTNTRISMDARIFGSYNFATGALPNADLEFNVPSSSIAFDGIKEKIKEIYLNGNGYFRPGNPDSTMVNINRMLVDGDGVAIYGKGSVKDLEGNPYLDIYLNSRINLDSLVKMFPQDADITGKGSLAAEMNVKTRMSNLTLYNLAKADIKGSVDARQMELGIPSQDIMCNIYGGTLKIGSNVTGREPRGKNRFKMIGVALNVDSTHIKYGNTLQLTGNSIVLSGENEASTIDTSSKNVRPFIGTFSAKRLNMRGADSVSLRISGTTNRFSILPYKGDISVPSLTLSSATERIMGRQGTHFVTLSKGTFKVNAHKNDRELKMREERMARLLDSLQLVYPQVQRDSLFMHWSVQRMGNRRGTRLPDDFAEEDYSFQLADKGIVHLLNRWEMSGEMASQAIRITTPAFPLRSKAENSKVSFSLNELVIEKSNIMSGRSSFCATGKISGIKNALTRGSRLKMELGIDADTLNFNEIAHALSAGEKYLGSISHTGTDTLLAAGSSEDLEEMVVLENTDTIAKMPLIIVPNNIDAKFNLNVNYGIYSSIILNKAQGEVTSRNRCLQISDFNANTSAGEMDLNAFYQTKSKKDLNVGFDLQFKDMNMGKFVKLYPGIDSLLPMLKSFEGIINCQMAATSQIDTNMNFLLPTIKGVARIKGDSLVLLDGETFAEIAKMMKFKNRERNLVDSIAVEIAINDGEIEVFPFIMKMDRYTTAISGKQDMELNFKYHISVLKSPVPMRLGIDISGNMDDFKFKIGKAKYKDANLPVYTRFIDSTRLSLRDYIKRFKMPQ